jgi:ribosomal-protein-alanine N-acetyltransferase
MISTTSQRLLLRPIQESDAPEIFGLRSDKLVNKYLDRALTLHLEEAISFIRKIRCSELYYWGICLKGELRLIGTICLWNFSADLKSAELGFELNPSFWAKGYMREAVDTVIGFAFRELDLRFIEAGTHSENKASQGLLLKSGFNPKPSPGGTEAANELSFIRYNQVGSILIG